MLVGLRDFRSVGERETDVFGLEREDNECFQVDSYRRERWSFLVEERGVVRGLSN